MFLDNLTKRERFIGLATLSIALLAVTYNFIIEPIAIWWSRLDYETASKSETFKKNLDLSLMYRNLESEYNKLSKYARSTKKEEEEVASVLTEIERVSRNSSCLIENIKPQGVKKINEHKEVLIEATAEADISQFSKFLYDIENSKNMLLKVKRFTINSKSRQQNILKCSFLISKLLLE